MKSSQTHELMECRKAAIRAIDEHRQNMIQALDTLLEASEGRTGKWSFVQTLFLHLRVNPLDFKVAIKDATYTRLLNAGFRRFGCSICGSKRWRAHSTSCKPCEQRLQSALAAKGPKVYVVANP
jgi:hypothetical protein